MKKKTIGVIGGLGPMASVYLLELITTMVDAKNDQEHPRIVMVSIPDTPDRTAYILGESDESPLPGLVSAARTVREAGADFLVIPCVTAQYFYKEICQAVDIPVISLCADVAKEATEQGVDSVAIFATDGTMKSKILEKDFKEQGIRVIRPSKEEQAEVMRLIYDEVKTGRIDTHSGAVKAWEDMCLLADKMHDRGAESVILGCTELSLIHRKGKCLEGEVSPESETNSRFIDILEVLAKRAVIRSGCTIG